MAQVRHPLDPLNADEITRAVEILRERPVTPEARFVSVSLSEPGKDQIALRTRPAAPPEASRRVPVVPQ